MKLLILCALILSAGCASNARTTYLWGSEPEPGADWMLERGKGLDEVALNKKRIVEGW